MNRLITLIIVCHVALPAMAKNKGDIEVSYRYSHPVQTMRSAVPDVTNQYILLTDGSRSKFYSPKTEYIDSIESTPEGFEKFNTFKRICYEKKQSDQIPRVDGSFYITKSKSDDKMMTFDIASATKFHWMEPMPHIEWNVSDSTMNIMGYECFMATADYHGRKWIAWFAPEIPVSDGPWKLCGLPGIILQAECDGDNTVLKLTAYNRPEIPNTGYTARTTGNQSSARNSGNFAENVSTIPLETVEQEATPLSIKG